MNYGDLISIVYDDFRSLRNVYHPFFNLPFIAYRHELMFQHPIMMSLKHRGIVQLGANGYSFTHFAFTLKSSDILKILNNLL